MSADQGIASEPASRLARARRLLRAQLETLVGLAAVAIRRIEGIVPPRIAVDAARPMAGLGALERAVGDHLRVTWALRLIAALRAKLVGDLARVERGEGLDEVLAAEARPAPGDEVETDPDPQAEIAAERREALGREREGLERESFGRYLSRRVGDAEFADILKRPTEDVIALIREALGLDTAQADGPAGLEREGPGSGQRPPGRVAPGQRPPPFVPLGLRSPYPA